MITRTSSLILLLLGWTCAFIPTAAGDAGILPLPTYTPSIFDELLREKAPDVELKLNFSTLLNSEPTEEYLTGELSYRLPGGAEVRRPVEVRVRGKFRRRVCQFPPLKLKFDKDVLRQAGLNPDYRSIKLVTHCLDDRFAGKENLLREYLIYKLYSLVTEQSYRVQLVRLTYIDTHGERRKIRRYGFFIEDPDEMADRLGGRECEDCLNPLAEEIALKEATLMAAFQYMIGNADWLIDLLR
jgi:hypothetical protein